MSEPTSGNDKRDSVPNQGHDEANEVKDRSHEAEPHNPYQASGSDFNDPTAPVWADPTTPLPAPPAQPTPAPPAQPTSPAPPTATTPPSNPYAQQPPAQPYDQSAAQHSQPQQPGYGQQYPASAQQSYATGATESNSSAIVLTVVSGITMLSTCFIIGIPSLVFGIMALTSNSTDPAGSRKKAKTGWIIFAVNVVVVVALGVILAIALFAMSSSNNNNFSY